MICQICNTKLDDDDVFCFNCGNRIIRYSEENLNTSSSPNSNFSQSSSSNSSENGLISYFKNIKFPREKHTDLVDFLILSQLLITFMTLLNVIILLLSGDIQFAYYCLICGIQFFILWGLYEYVNEIRYVFILTLILDMIFDIHYFSFLDFSIFSFLLLVFSIYVLFFDKKSKDLFRGNNYFDWSLFTGNYE